MHPLKQNGEPYLECYEVSGLVKVGEFHSHGRIPAFFSATDDEDETFPGLYGVVSCGVTGKFIVPY